jgi:molybdopterin/thiamine biosynthesis adenylyltransferase
MQSMRELSVVVCGAGAIGANIVENLARQGFAHIRSIDFDRIEERNLSTQPYYASDIGAFKAKILANSIYRALGVKVDARAEELTSANAAKLLGGAALIVDAFDNSASRQAVKDYCDKAGVACLHVGLASEYGEIIWNENYRVPSDAGQDDCDYPLARNLVMMTVAVASEVIARFAATGEKDSFTITLEDFAVRPYSFSNA